MKEQHLEFLRNWKKVLKMLLMIVLMNDHWMDSNLEMAMLLLVHLKVFSMQLNLVLMQ